MRIPAPVQNYREVSSLIRRYRRMLSEGAFFQAGRASAMDPAAAIRGLRRLHEWAQTHADSVRRLA